VRCWNLDIKKIFRKYVESYDINDRAIILKLDHSYRVMELCELIARENNLNNRDIKIAKLIGLLHDYARFEQWTKFGTYSDIKSIDHGDLAIEMLFENNEIINYCSNREYYNYICDAIKYHNKCSYPNNLNERNKLFCKIIRDADKLDIFYLLGINKELIREDKEEISSKIKEDFFNNKLLNRKDVNNENDNIILDLAMVFDLNFKYSFKYLEDNSLIDKFFENIDNKIKFKPYFDYIKSYIRDKIK